MKKYSDAGPIKPHDMPFCELQAELPLIERENRMDAAFNLKLNKAQLQPQNTKPQLQPQPQPQIQPQPQPTVLHQPLRQYGPQQFQPIERYQKPIYEAEIMQDLILQMQHLAVQLNRKDLQRLLGFTGY